MIPAPRYHSFRPGPVASLFLALAALTATTRAKADLSAPYSNTVTLETFASGVNAATDIAWASDGRAVVTRKTGEITIIDTEGLKTQLTGTFSNVDSASEKGLNGVIADPTVANGFFFYVDNGPSTSDKHRVYHGVLSASANTLTVDTQNPIVAAGRNTGDPGLEGPANHDGGGLFIYENHLYVGVGDTGQNATPPTNKYGSCLNKGNGKILRVNLDGTIPTDNPLVNVASVTSCDVAGSQGDWGTAAPDKRIFAWGFRNPWRFWVDAQTGLMWIGDVGETTREEISVGGGNQHYGWPFDEGTVTWPDGDMTAPDGTLDGKSCNTGFSPAKACTPPVHDYGRTGGANCVIGGLIPEGCGWSSAFSGKTYYLFSDHGANWLHALEVKSDRTGVTSSTATDMGTFASNSGIASMRQGPDGAVYVVANGAGAVYRLKPKDATGPDCMSTGGAGGMGGMSSGGQAGTGGRSGGNGGAAGADASGGMSGSPGASGSSAGGMQGGGGASSGGLTGSGGMSSGGAATSAGGMTTASGGVPALGGTSSTTAGSSTSSAGSATTGAGRTGDAGSVSGSAGSSAAKPPGGDNHDAKDSGGCGCRTAGHDQGGLAAWVAALALASVITRRRRFRS